MCARIRAVERGIRAEMGCFAIALVGESESESVCLLVLSILRLTVVARVHQRAQLRSLSVVCSLQPQMRREAQGEAICLPDARLPKALRHESGAGRPSSR